jgi:predicted HicB family RNase H-like nuclease
MKLSEPIPLDLTPSAWVYRLWNADGDCLYVGQHKGFHPAARVKDHRTQPWWNEVTRADYVEALEGELDIAEKQQIHDLNALYNDGGWKTLHPNRLTTGKTITTFYVEESLLTLARERAVLEGRSLNSLIVRALNQELERWL